MANLKREAVVQKLWKMLQLTNGAEEVNQGKQLGRLLSFIGTQSDDFFQTIDATLPPAVVWGWVEEAYRKSLHSPSGVSRPRQFNVFSHMQTKEPMYVNIKITNDRVEPNIQVEAKALVSCTCEAELVLPTPMVQQLALESISVKNALDPILEMTVYRSFKVEVELTDGTSPEVLGTRSADLVPQAMSNGELRVHPDVDANIRHNAGIHVQAEEFGIVQLSPVKRTDLEQQPACILGIRGLQKLALQLDPEEYRLLHVRQVEFIL